MPTFVTRHLPHLGHRQNNLLPREPALINLPIPVPSIPVLDPIVTPLIQGANPQPSPSTLQPPAPPPPEETPTAVNPSPTYAGGGGDTGGGSGSGNEGSSGGGSGQPTDSGSLPNPSGGGGNGQNGGATGTGLGVGQAPSGVPESVNGVAAPSSSSSPGDGGNVLADGNTPVNAANDPSNDNGNSSDGSGSGSGSVGSGNGSESSSSGNDGSTHAGVSVDIPGVTSMPTATGVGGGVGGGNGSGNGSGNTVGADAEQRHELSGGAVAGIVMAILLVAVAVTIILLRRRFQLRRSDRRKKWWSSHEGSAQAYGDRGVAVASSGGIVGLAGGQRRSVRSSFETTVDHSAIPRLEEDLGIPSLPPMAELRGPPVLLINLDNPVSPAAETRSPDVNIKITPESRFSVGSVSSVGSDGQGQWLFVNREHLAPEVGTPMSVRPFSPSESFAFPKPPTEKSSGDWGSQFSRPTSLNTPNASFVNASGVKHPQSHGVGASIAEEVPALPVPSPAANPFNDPDPIALYSTAAAALGVASSPRSPGTPSEINVATAKNSKDPFADPEPRTPSTVNPEFMEIETIKRPFVPSLNDELPVDLGDKVRILQLFDDGWALVEKNPICGPASATGKGKEPEKGLIPIDCFRAHGVELSEFITSKRLSSYSQISTKYISGGVAA